MIETLQEVKIFGHEIFNEFGSKVKRTLKRKKDITNNEGKRKPRHKDYKPSISENFVNYYMNG